MYNMNIRYAELINKWEEILSYLLKHSDRFSLILDQRKPYSQRPAVCKQDIIIEKLDKFLCEQKVGIREWPGTRTHEKHKVMNIYVADKRCKDILLSIGNLFEFSNEQPIDITFYRENQPWFISITHEKEAYIYNGTINDVYFFEAVGVLY